MTIHHSYPIICYYFRNLWVAIDVVTRAVVPSLINAYYACIRNQQTVVDSFRYQLLPAVVAFLANSLSRSLASVQRITVPLTMRAIRNQNMTEQEQEYVDVGPEKCVQCEVLTTPEGEILADVIFIHGLHGGLDKTWKQGTWRNSNHKLVDQFPVRRQCSEDYYVPPKPRSLKRALSQYYSKIPHKIARRDDEICVTQDEDDWHNMMDEIENDENYSKCWPQDWLPKDCPGARVIALNYTTDVLWCPLWLRKRNR